MQKPNVVSLALKLSPHRGVWKATCISCVYTEILVEPCNCQVPLPVVLLIIRPLRLSPVFTLWSGRGGGVMRPASPSCTSPEGVAFTQLALVTPHTVPPCAPHMGV